MKQLWKDFWTAVFLGLLLPGIFLNAGQLILETKGDQPEPAVEETVRWPVKVRSGDSVEEMDMDFYLTQVVLAEMPASFDSEALKAQSVAARTYAYKASVTGGKHGDGSVCTDPTCCQGYLPVTTYLEKGGTQESVDKIAAAVAATTGYVLTYGGELIEATYFSSSGGSTEDAAAVWGTAFPYLQSVSSPEENAQQYTQTLSFTPEAFQSLLGRTLTGAPKDWFTITTYTEGGGVASMTIGGVAYAGTELRTLLGLRSTVFEVEASDSGIEITTRGYGHRVGLSQCGAETMALSGKTFREILTHYYTGTELAEISTMRNSTGGWRPL